MSSRWAAQARPEQLPPAGDWFTWLILAGRGWGKTRVGAEWAAAMGRRYPGARIALVAPTKADARDTMIEGESGLLACLHDVELHGCRRESGWNRSLGEVFLANGSRYKTFSAEQPGRLRGPQHHFAWADEPAVWADANLGARARPEADTTWSNLVVGLRLRPLDAWPAGFQPRVVATTTPKRVTLLKSRDSDNPGLLQQERVTLTTGRTVDNLANLADTYVDQVVRPLEGTRLGRQELNAELLENVEGALWTHDPDHADRESVGLILTARAELDASSGHLLFDGGRVRLPLARRIVAVDPSDGREGGDKQGYAVAAWGLDQRIYVLHSEELLLHPAAQVDRAKALYDRFRGDRVVVERNHGRGYLVETFHRMHPSLPVVFVDATQGKRTRAEPVAALYQRRLVTHVLLGDADHTTLESQMTGYIGAPGDVSPNALDALVYAVTSLTEGHRGQVVVPLRPDLPETGDLDTIGF